MYMMQFCIMYIRTVTIGARDGPLLGKLTIACHHEGQYEFVNPFLKSWLTHQNY